MTEFLLFCIATVGMTSIITQGVIFQPFRQFFGNWAEKIHKYREQKVQVTNNVPRRSFVEWFSELVNCAQCTGFWCGLFCGLLLISFEGCWTTGFVHTSETTGHPYTECNPLLLWRVLLTWFCYGLGGSFLSSFGCNLIDWVFYRKMNALRQLEEQDLTLAERRTNSEIRE